MLLSGCSSSSHRANGDAAGDRDAHAFDASDGTIDAPASTGSTGASQATCNGTCTTGPLPTYPSGTTCQPAGTVLNGSVYLGLINNGVADECRIYSVSIPNNLNHDGTPGTGTPAAVLLAGGGGNCGSGSIAEIHTQTRWDDVAAMGHFIVIKLMYPIGCARTAWLHPNIDVPDPGPGQPSDLPYIRAVIADIQTRYHVDPLRIYMTGASSGGAESWSIACDDATNVLIRGVAPVSNTMQEQASGTSPVPGTERCAAIHHGFFAYMVSGPNDYQASYNPTGIPAGGPYTHFVSGFAETRRFFAGHLGCSATPTTTMFGATAKNTHYQYGNCGFGSPADQFLATDIANGGHTNVCLDSEPGVIPNQCHGTTPATDGFWAAKDIWDFFATRQW